jgi:hypothetical protein
LKTSTPKKKERSNRPTTKSKSKSKAKTAPGAGAKKGTVPTPLPHTLVLCLRSVPVSQADARPGHGHSNPSLSIFPPSNPSSHPTTENQIHTLQILNIPTTPTTPTTPSPLTPLSPLSPTFNSSNHSEFGSERDGKKQRNKERDQRRKKIAKLTRTLGENVPPELVFPSPVSASVALDAQKDAAIRLARKSSNAFRTKSQSMSAPPYSSSSPSARPNTDSTPPPPAASSSASASPPPSALLERYPSRHRREKQGSAQLTVTIPEKKHTHSSRTKGFSAGSGSDDKVEGADADQGDDEGASNGSRGFRNVAGPARAQVECPPSLAALFHPHLTSEENVDSLRFSSRGQHHLKTHRHAHSSPSPSPVDTVKSDVFSDSHDTLLPTPASTSALAPAPARTRTPTPTPLSRLPSLLNRKSSASKSQSTLGGNKAPKSHNVKSKSMGLVEEVFGVGFVAGRGRDEDWEEVSRARDTGGTPLPLPFPFPPSRSGTSHPVPSRCTTPHFQECGRRKEKGWSGEWNRGDMEEVVKGLRELKAR